MAESSIEEELHGRKFYGRGLARSPVLETSVSKPPGQISAKQFSGFYFRPTESEFLCKEPRNSFSICIYVIYFKKH